MQLSIRTIRWLAIIVPTLLLATLDLIRHQIIQPQFHTVFGFLTTYAIVAVGITVFSFVVFGLVERLQNRVVEQNQQLIGLNEQLERQNRELAAVVAIGKVATSAFAEEDLPDRLLDAVREAVPAGAAELWLPEPNGDLVQRGVRGQHPEAFRQITRLSIDNGLPGLAMNCREPVVVEPISEDPRFLRTEVVERGFQCYCALPLCYRNRPVAVLGLATLKGCSRIGAEDLELLEAIAEWMALAIENTRLYHQEQTIAVLEERERIAREMHDGMAQVLGYVNTQTLAVKRLVAQGQRDEARTELTRMEEITRQLYIDIREGIIGLRGATTRNMDLVSALREYADGFTSMCGIPVRIDASANSLPSIDSHDSIQLIRIVQEALSNARKHAAASIVRVDVSEPNGYLKLDIIDDGSGFDIDQLPAARGPRFGLTTMRERAESIGGTLEIESNPERGTSVSVRIPTSRLEVV